MTELRQPIVSLLGHVDHGKTSLLDRIAGSVRAEREAGGITQHIGAIEVPRDSLLSLFRGVLPTDQFVVPGLLFVDTPGHRSFETLRRRGGALADLAVVVIDVREGSMPQTRESIQILRHEKTPFAVALTKIDLVAGWRKPTTATSLVEQVERCGVDYSRKLDERLYAVSEELSLMGFSAERYDRVSDFTRNVTITPVSSKFNVGVGELLAVLVGLSQRFLKTELALLGGGGEATILERSDQKGVGPVGNVIVYRGRLKVGDEIVATGRTGPFTTRVRGIFRPRPPTRDRSPRVAKLESLVEVSAASGVYLAAPGVEDALPGGLLKVVATPGEAEAAITELTRESHPVAELAESGVAIYADTLGGLEAIAFECREAGVPIHEAGVGPIGRSTVLKIASVKNPVHRAVLAFNVPVLPDAQPEGAAGPVRMFRGDVMYRILEEYLAWKTERLQALSARRRAEVPRPAKFQVLPGFVFRHSKPAIVGIKVLGGTLRAGVRLMRGDGSEAGALRALQKDGVSVPQAETGTELAASIEGVVVGRTLREGDELLVALSEGAVRALRSESLPPVERAILDEVVRIRRATEPFWGQGET